MRILIVCNNGNPNALDASKEIVDYLDSVGIESIIHESFDLPRTPSMPVGDEQTRLGLFYPSCADGVRIDMIVALGGDGTILRCARLAGVSGVPILGINFGHLGFLSNSHPAGALHIVKEALAGNCTEEKRTNLYVELEYPVYEHGENLPDQDVREIGATQNVSSTLRCNAALASVEYFALNEVAISRGSSGRMIDLSIKINDTHLANMRGDGLVISSATGSTAYALSAGGPLMAPTNAGLLLVPLASHSLRMRPVVTGGTEIAVVDLLYNQATREATIFIDGNKVSIPAPVTRVTVRRGTAPTTLLKYESEGFYSHAARTFF